MKEQTTHSGKRAANSFVYLTSIGRMCIAHTFARLFHSHSLCPQMQCEKFYYLSRFGDFFFSFSLFLTHRPIFEVFGLYLLCRPTVKQMRETETVRDYFICGRLSNRMTEVLKRGDMSLINCTVSEKRSLPNVELKSE